MTSVRRCVLCATGEHSGTAPRRCCSRPGARRPRAHSSLHGSLCVSTGRTCAATTADACYIAAGVACGGNPGGASRAPSAGHTAGTRLLRVRDAPSRRVAPQHCVGKHACLWHVFACCARRLTQPAVTLQLSCRSLRQDGDQRGCRVAPLGNACGQARFREQRLLSWAPRCGRCMTHSAA